MSLNINFFKKNISLLNTRYPVGSIYWTEDVDFNPNEYWGGTWEQIKDRFLMASGVVYTNVGGQGGSSSVTLTSSNIPEHSHTVESHYHRIYANTTMSKSSSGSVADKTGYSGSASLPLGSASIALKANGQETGTSQLQFTVTSGGYARTLSATISEHGHTFTNPAYNGSTTIYGDSSHSSTYKDKTGSSSPGTDSAYSSNPTAITTMPEYEIAICWKRTA